LLFNVSGALVYGGTSRIVNLRHGVGLYIRRDVQIQIQRDPDLLWPSRSLAIFG
jgi:hypothetical protein